MQRRRKWARSWTTEPINYQLHRATWNFTLIGEAVPEKTLFNIFLQSNIAPKTWDPTIILYDHSIPKSWGTCLWSFTSTCSAVLEKKVFEGFRANPRWLPDHATHDVIVINHYSAWRFNHLCAVSLLYSAWLVDHLCAVSLLSLKRFWRKEFFLFFLFFKQCGCQSMWQMAS